MWRLCRAALSCGPFYRFSLWNFSRMIFLTLQLTYLVFNSNVVWSSLPARQFLLFRLRVARSPWLSFASLFSYKSQGAIAFKMLIERGTIFEWGVFYDTKLFALQNFRLLTANLSRRLVTYFVNYFWEKDWQTSTFPVREPARFLSAERRARSVRVSGQLLLNRWRVNLRLFKHAYVSRAETLGRVHLRLSRLERSIFGSLFELTLLIKESPVLQRSGMSFTRHKEVNSFWSLCCGADNFALLKISFFWRRFAFARQKTIFLIQARLLASRKSARVNLCLNK